MGEILHHVVYYRAHIITNIMYHILYIIIQGILHHNIGNYLGPYIILSLLPLLTGGRSSGSIMPLLEVLRKLPSLRHFLAAKPGCRVRLSEASGKHKDR